MGFTIALCTFDKTKIMNSCALCKYRIEKVKYLKDKMVNHLNFENIKKSDLKKCKKCFLIQNHKQFQKFSTSFYRKINQSDLFVFSDKKKINKNKFQHEYISKNVKLNKNSKILDFGCNKGDLLFYFKKHKSIKNVYGYDVNKYFKNDLKKKKINYENFYKSTKKFDLIIFSHSLFYVKNLGKLFNQVNKKLLPKGKLYIEIPDLNQNPIYSLMGDQSYIFTRNSLINVLRYFNFTCTSMRIKNTENLSFFCTKKNLNKIKFVKDFIFEKSQKKLKQKIKIIKSLKLKKINIFGTTSKAAFLDNILKKKTSYFVDENPTKINNKFRGKITLHPRKLQNQDKTIISTSNQLLLKKLKKSYTGTFLNV